MKDIHDASLGVEYPAQRLLIIFKRYDEIVGSRDRRDHAELYTCASRLEL
jgi:hypothetical protein